MDTPFLLESTEIIEGIGSVQQARLDAEGIGNIGAMFRAGPAKVRHTCDGSGKRQVGNWFCAAALLRIKGMTPDLAEWFVRSGVRSVRSLAERPLQAVETALLATEPGRALDVYTLAALQQSALQRQEHGLLFGRVLTRDGDPFPGITVDIEGFECVTNTEGWFAFDSIPARTYDPRIALSSWPLPLRLHALSVSAGRLHGPVIVRAPRVDAAASFLPAEKRELDGHRIVNTRSTTVRLDDRELADFLPDTLFEVRSLPRNRARLLSLYLVKRGFTILVQRAEVSQSMLPTGATNGNVLRWDGHALALTDLTRLQVNEQKLATARAHRIRRERRPIVHVRSRPGSEVMKIV